MKNLKLKSARAAMDLSQQALADMVASRGLDWSGCRPLIESMRIEPDDLETLTAEDFESLEGAYYSKRARRFLSGLRKDLEV